MDTSGQTIDCVPPRRHSHSPLAHGVAHRLSGGRGADPLPPRLSPHYRAQPDPRERPRARRHAPDRAQEPRHLRPLQHHPRAGTARGRRPAGRLSGAAGAGGASPSAAPRGRPRRAARVGRAKFRRAHLCRRPWGRSGNPRRLRRRDAPRPRSSPARTHAASAGRVGVGVGGSGSGGGGGATRGVADCDWVAVLGPTLFLARTRNLYKFSSSISCSKWLHETEPGRLDQ